MGQPSARLADTTATGDTITGPGVTTVLVGNMCCSVIGDSVSGNACVGAVAGGSATVLVQNRMAARVGDTVSGANPYSGVPVTTTIAKGEYTVLMG